MSNSTISTPTLVDSLDLYDNCLYQNGVIWTFYEQGEQALVRTPLVLTPTLEDQWHTVRGDDTLDKIAWKYYKNKVVDPSKYWWVIADANNVFNPFDLSSYVGTDILVPDIVRVKLLLIAP